MIHIAEYSRIKDRKDLTGAIYGTQRTLPAAGEYWQNRETREILVVWAADEWEVNGRYLGPTSDRELEYQLAHFMAKFDRVDPWLKLAKDSLMLQLGPVIGLQVFTGTGADHD